MIKKMMLMTICWKNKDQKKNKKEEINQQKKNK